MEDKKQITLVVSSIVNGLPLPSRSYLQVPQIEHYHQIMEVKPCVSTMDGISPLKSLVNFGNHENFCAQNIVAISSHVE